MYMYMYVYMYMYMYIHIHIHIHKHIHRNKKHSYTYIHVRIDHCLHLQSMPAPINFLFGTFFGLPQRAFKKTANRRNLGTQCDAERQALEDLRLRLQFELHSSLLQKFFTLNHGFPVCACLIILNATILYLVPSGPV